MIGEKAGASMVEIEKYSQISKNQTRFGHDTWIKKIINEYKNFQNSWELGSLSMIGEKLRRNVGN